MAFGKSLWRKWLRVLLLVIIVIFSWILVFHYLKWKINDWNTQPEEIESYCLGHEKFWLEICKEMEYAKQKQDDSLNNVIARSYRKEFRQKVLAEQNMKKCLRRFTVLCGIDKENGVARLTFQRKVGFLGKILLDLSPLADDYWRVYFIIDDKSPFSQKLRNDVLSYPKQSFRQNGFFCWSFGGNWVGESSQNFRESFK